MTAVQLTAALVLLLGGATASAAAPKVPASAKEAQVRRISFNGKPLGKDGLRTIERLEAQGGGRLADGAYFPATGAAGMCRGCRRPRYRVDTTYKNDFAALGGGEVIPGYGCGGLQQGRQQSSRPVFMGVLVRYGRWRRREHLLGTRVSR